MKQSFTPYIVLFALVLILIFGIPKLGKVARNMITSPISSEKDNEFEPVSLPNNIDMRVASVRADTVYEAMNVIGTHSKKLFQVLSPLNYDELRAVYNAYGVRWLHALYIPYFKGNLIEALDMELTGWGEGNNLEKMGEIWRKTGLWHLKQH